MGKIIGSQCIIDMSVIIASGKVNRVLKMVDKSRNM